MIDKITEHDESLESLKELTDSIIRMTQSEINRLEQLISTMNQLMIDHLQEEK